MTVDRVSRNRPRTQDRQPKRTRSQPKSVGLARVTYLSDEHAECSCGWTVSHSREKVREDAIDRHLGKKHAGRGIRL